jgi:hypothetical protein
MQMVTVAPTERTWSPTTVLNPEFCTQHNYSKLLCVYLVPPRVVQFYICLLIMFLQLYEYKQPHSAQSSDWIFPELLSSLLYST